VAKWDENKNNKSDLETPTERSPSGNTLTPSSNISSTTATSAPQQQQHQQIEDNNNMWWSGALAVELYL